MISVLIFGVGAKLRCILEQLPQKDSGIAIVGIADDQHSLAGLVDRSHADVVLTQEMPTDEIPPRRRGQHNGTAWVLFLDPTSGRANLEALTAGVSAILPPSADLAAIVATIRMVANGLVVFPRQLLTALPGGADFTKRRLSETDDDHPRLSKREIAVLTAMADGLSNKEIARRLGISFHTVKFHVASILEKLEADTRTEAVFKAAQLGLVML
jgi:two-component system, NarL family, response regulator YdfI